MLGRVTSWLASLRKARAESVWAERQFHVEVPDHGLSSAFPTGETQFLAWKDVARILVETNDSGPLGADVWWVLEGGSSRCTFPQGATGENDALSEIQRRFASFEAKGMNSSSVATFVCWEKGHAL
jgi:hypothetical protein